MEIGHTIMLMFFYLAGIMILIFLLLIPMTFLAGIARTFLFHWLSRRRHMGMDPSTVIGLNKQQMDIFLFCTGYIFLLMVYSYIFFHFV